MNKKDKLINLILPVVTIGCILILWSVASILVDSKYILPSVADTFSTFISLFSDKNFYIVFSLTLLRSLIAFAISFVVSGICAYVAYKNKRAERVILTIMSLLRALPTVAIVPLLLFWTNGNGQVSPVVVTLIVVMPTTYTHIKSAFESLDKTTVEASMVDGANKLQSLIKVEFPQIAPAVYSAIGSGISLNFKLMVAAEVLSATAKSLGNALNDAKFSFDIALMLAMVITAVAFGIIIEAIFNKISKHASN